MLRLPTRTGERPRYKIREEITRKFTKLIPHKSTFCKWINVEVPEAKSKSHDVLTVSNASQMASKLHLLTNTSQGKPTSGFQVNAQMFSCPTKSDFYMFVSSRTNQRPSSPTGVLQSVQLVNM